MTEKEKNDKENEKFSFAVLYIATAIYISICTMVMGGLYAKMPTLGEAFLEFFKDYGAIIAGIPVLIAVLVAKQQLDANRKQHVATVKRNLRSELESLHALERFADDITGLNEHAVTQHIGQTGFLAPYIFRPARSALDKWKDLLPSPVHSYAEETWIQAGQLMDACRQKGATTDGVKKQLGATKIYAEVLKKNVRVHFNHLSQYWS